MNLGAVGVIVAARMSSSRLPRKALLPLQGIPMLRFLLRRLHGLRAGQVVLATTDLVSDDALADIATAEGISVFRGDEADVVGRYVAAARRFGFDTVARVTADCPFVDAELVDWCLGQAATLDQFDLVTTKTRFPMGLDVEIYAAQRMAELHSRPLSAAEREHLTLHFYQNECRFGVRLIDPPLAWPRTSRRFTVDTSADYENAKRLAQAFPSSNFSISALLSMVADEARA